jgi:hypothetical protein
MHWNPDLVDYEDGTPISSLVGFPISLVNFFLFFRFSNLTVEWTKWNHACWGPRKLSILNSFLVFPRPVNFAAQSSVGMKNSQKLSSKTSSETLLLTRFVIFSVCWLIWTTTRTNDTKETQHGPRRPTEVLVELLMVRQPLPPFHLPPLSHRHPSLHTIPMRLHLLLLQESLWSSPLTLGTSSTTS